MIPLICVIGGVVAFVAFFTILFPVRDHFGPRMSEEEATADDLLQRLRRADPAKRR